jgi:hypothetical protein
LINLIGKKFGHLTVIKRDTSKVGKNIYWICRCDCGNTVSVRSGDLKDGSSKSCGCIKSRGEDKIRKILFSLKINFI